MRIAVIGTGYVGLVVGTCFADTGNDVICADVDQAKIDGLNQGRVPIYEPGLTTMIGHNVEEGRLRFTTDVGPAIRDSEIVFIAVGTPEGEDGSADLQYVLSVAKTIGENLNGYKIVVDKSTVPVGTAEKVAEAIRETSGSDDFSVVSNPEFLKEGAAISDFLKPDRVVIGVDDEQARQAMERLYAPFTRTGKPILFMSVRSAELTKYAANAMLATRISFMNEIARLCNSLGANVNDIRRGMGTDSRIGSSFLFPGCGYGGSCFPKDVKALMRTGEEAGEPLRILTAVEEVNAGQKRLMAEMALAHYDGNLKDKVFALWGLAFKPKTDDMREAPSLTIIEALLEQGARVQVNDPVAMPATKRILGDRVAYFDKPMQAVDGADALILVTEWNEYRQPDFPTIAAKLGDRVIFDGRNIWDRKTLEGMGFTYYGIGV
ncbi:MAG TPA: UDP-glucose/GDP-mannose dehydrogenase family protein [Planctomycetes bacterium]|nr:UDP-glucose/GDP-mannose dehydrogenase family protein [Planctomycetota bacterium]